MKRFKKAALFMVFIFSLWTIDHRLLTAANAAVPHLINYQGKLTDTSGSPLNGSYDITFRIYDAETAGNLLWEETQPGVVVSKGLLSTLLGSVTALNIPFDKPYYLEIKVGSEVMTPRQRITSAGYAIRAEKADSVDGIDPGMVGTKTVNETGLADGMIPYYDNASGTIKWKSPDRKQLFTSSGIFTAPAGVTTVYLSGCAGGGGGGAASVVIPSQGSGGGGAGANISKMPYTIVPGNNYTVTIGNGGVGSVHGATPGGNGEDTVFGSITLKGGYGGDCYYKYYVGGIQGGKAANIIPGFGWTGGDGITGSETLGGAGGGGIFGKGGEGRTSAGDGISATIGYGGGGGGGQGDNTHGGNGAKGMMLVEW